MKIASDEIVKTLKERGYRFTEARESIVNTLAKQSAPLTIAELAGLVNVDQATVYRTVDLLRKEGLLLEINVVGEQPRFELGHDHHHHLVCTGCQKIAHLPCESVDIPRRVPETFAEVSGHEVTFYGKCKKCL